MLNVINFKLFRTGRIYLYIPIRAYQNKFKLELIKHIPRALALSTVLIQEPMSCQRPFSIIIVVMQFLPGRPLHSFSLSMRSQNVLIVSRCG